MLELDDGKLEALMAILTLVRHVIRMDPHMSLQRSSISKRLATFIALIRSVCLMFPHVALEVSFCEKFLGTQITSKRLLSCVLSEMVGQLLFRIKPFAAVSEGAPELQVSVFCFMLISGGFGFKGEATMRAEQVIGLLVVLMNHVVDKIQMFSHQATFIDNVVAANLTDGLMRILTVHFEMFPNLFIPFFLDLLCFLLERFFP